jgi:hypothetical protein
MHPGGSIEYQFVAASSKEMIRDKEFARVSIPVVFEWRCGSVVRRLWCEL